jgi:tripartite-type tricarboxylate transporter receptor subunit TctC
MNEFLKNIVVKIIGAVVILAFGAVPAVCAAQTYPSRPIRVVVPSAPGGLADIATRMVAQKMSESLGQQLIVENRAGADTMLGVRYVKAAPADGYTVLSTSNTVAAQPVMKLDPGYELKDFVGIGPVVRSPWMMLIGPGQPDKSLADFIVRAKANPEALTFASGGVGTTPYLAEQMLLQRAGLKLTHIPYKGIGAAMPDVMSGRVTMVFDAVGSSAAHVRGGQLRALGVASMSRLPVLPEVPTIAEQGMPGFSVYVTIGMLARAGTPREIVDKLAAALQRALASKEIRDRFEADGAEAVSMSPDEFTEALNRDQADFAKLATQLGMEKQ